MAEIVRMPKLGFDMAEGALVRWVIQEGEAVKKGAILAEIETDKATVEVESIYEGLLAQHLVQVGEVVPVNTPIALIAAPGEKVERQVIYDQALSLQPESPDATPSKAPEMAPPSTDPTASADRPVIGRLPGGLNASPLARRMAAQAGISLTSLPGSGPGGRIVKRDVTAYLSSGARVNLTDAALSSSPSIGATSTPVDEIIPLNRLRAAIGRRMLEAKQQTPHFYVTHEYDMDSLLALRTQINVLLPEEDKISVNDFIVKATALILRQFPNLNASLDGDQVIQHGAINIGVAVAVEGGLLTVVCRDADRKPLRQIASELRGMAARARQGKVRPEEIEGSTFSISNLGMYDVEHFIAIINPPEAAILAVGSARQVPVVQDGQIVPGRRMKATISVDHRLSDGAEAARFMQALAPYLEEPVRLLL